jgi:hypothetical protein
VRFLRLPHIWAILIILSSVIQLLLQLTYDRFISRRVSCVNWDIYLFITSNALSDPQCHYDRSSLRVVRFLRLPHICAILTTLLSLILLLSLPTLCKFNSRWVSCANWDIYLFISSNALSDPHCHDDKFNFRMVRFFMLPYIRAIFITLLSLILLLSSPIPLRFNRKWVSNVNWDIYLFISSNALSDPHLFQFDRSSLRDVRFLRVPQSCAILVMLLSVILLLL